MDPTYLDSVIFEPPVEDDADVDVEGSGDSNAEFDADDFPAWYRDKVADADAGNTEEAEDGDDGKDGDEQGNYPFDLAVVQTIDRLKFGHVTVLAGDNGSGKSTLVEAIAVAAGFNAEGGSKNLMFRTHDTHSPLAEHLLLRWKARPRWGWFLRAETFYGMATHIANDDHPDEGLAAIFPDLHNQSHGETFLALAHSRFTGAGLYIFDEPEAALSIQGQMELAEIMTASITQGAQFIISTHSPYLMGFPGATIYEIDAQRGVEASTFDELVAVKLWREFLHDDQ